MAKRQSKSKERPRFQARVELRGLNAEDQRPQMAVYAIDRSGKTLETKAVDEKGQFQLSSKALATAERIVIGPQEEDIQSMDQRSLSVYRADQFRQVVEAGGLFEIPKKIWVCWIHIRKCVSGSVKHCHFWHWPWITQFETPTVALANASSLQLGPQIDRTKLTDLQIAKPPKLVIPPIHCHTVCDGVVEVYRRTCCCWPWIIYDPRLPQLELELEELLTDPPIVKWPPRPGPDPVPFDRINAQQVGALDQKRLNARRDLEAIRTLPALEVAEYIKARPYLLCSCGIPVKVASGFIQPNGEFHICWWECNRLLLANCHDDYAFKVKQNIDGETVTIYDGVLANRWYHYGDHAELTSFHSKAVSCDSDDFPGTGAFALLQDIGLTGSWRLKTPNATGWDRVANPVYNDGLAFPAANAAAAKGKYLDRNWGGLLRLRYHFSKEMRSMGARYYRVSVIAADANGNPTGDRTYLSPPEWKYFEFNGTIINTGKVSLGPSTVGGNANLYDIPYLADRRWQSGQYHALLDTTEFANGRFLLTLEVFNSTGQLIRPNGTTDPGGSVQGAYTYRRWYQEVRPTAEVPFAALTHMLWWDNRKAEAQIVDFRVDGVKNTGECQFLEDKDSADFSVGYRAYHPQPMFLADHRLWWRRGLGGPSGILTSPHPNPDNVGAPPAAAHESGSDTFKDMLGTHQKCTFTINLHANVKTFNGIGTLDGLDDWDYASVALAIEAPTPVISS